MKKTNAFCKKKLNYILGFSANESVFSFEKELNNDADAFATMAKRIGGSLG